MWPLGFSYYVVDKSQGYLNTNNQQAKKFNYFRVYKIKIF